MTKKDFSAIDQLEILLKEYPKNRDFISIEPLILDYLGQSGGTILDVFNINPHIYGDLYAGERVDLGRRLVRYLASPGETNALRQHPKFVDYPKFVEMISEMGREKSTERSPVAHPERALEEGIAAVVWQLSDVHFGKLNKLEPEAGELAAMLEKVANEYPSVRPNILAISGDVSSVAAESEFAAFADFCRAFGQRIWGNDYAERILVVPGNHDTTWLDSGCADRLSRFRALVADTGCCITPFGPAEERFSDDSIIVRRFGGEADKGLRSGSGSGSGTEALGVSSAPPVAEVTFQEYDIRFVLLVSSFFSGEVPAEIRAVLRGDFGKDDDSFIDSLRKDDGAINREYLATISRLPDSAMSTIAMTHHNPIGYGVEVVKNRFATQLLETLYKRGVSVVLHGHTHLTDDPGSKRQALDNQCYPIPCPTLTSITSAGSPRGFNVHLLGKPTHRQRMATVLWSLAGSEGFNLDGAILRYRINLSLPPRIEHNPNSP